MGQCCDTSTHTIACMGHSTNTIEHHVQMPPRTPSSYDLGNKDCDEIRASIEGGWSKGVMGHLANPVARAWSPCAPTYSSSHLGCSESANHCEGALEGEEKDKKGFRGSGMGYA